jgi:hypothetical protein
MKNRALTITIFLLGTFTLIPITRADSLAPKNPRTLPFSPPGRDISQSTWQSWQAPVGTVDPSRLIPNDSTESMAASGLPQNQFNSLKFDSFQSAKSFEKGTPIEVEQTKPIEKFETENPAPVNQSTPALATAVPKTNSDSKRIVMVALISVAVLAYRKFRRAHAGRYPPKPNFL